MQRLARTYYLQDPDQETHQFMAGTPIGSLPDWFADAAPDALFDGDGEDEDQSLSVDEDSVGVAFHDADTDEMTKAEIMAELDRLGADYTKRDNHNKLAQALTLARAAVEND